MPCLSTPRASKGNAYFISVLSRSQLVLTVFCICRVALTPVNDTFASLTAPSWPYAPGPVQLCIGASVAAAAAVAISTPSGCSDFEFVALFEGASLTGRAADTSTKLTVARQHSDRVSFYIGGSGFSPEWSGVLCVLRCGDCSSFSAATFHSGVMSSCSVPPACSNASACNLSLSFPASTFPVASVVFEVPGEDFTAYGFSVNGCTGNCTALLSPFDAMLLLRFLAGGRSGPLWVQAVPHNTMVLEKPPAYPVEDVVPIRRGTSSNGRTMVSASSRGLARASSFMSYSHVFSRSHFISANAAAAAPTLRLAAVFRVPLQRTSTNSCLGPRGHECLRPAFHRPQSPSCRPNWFHFAAASHHAYTICCIFQSRVQPLSVGRVRGVKHQRRRRPCARGVGHRLIFCHVDLRRFVNCAITSNFVLFCHSCS